MNVNVNVNMNLNKYTYNVVVTVIFGQLFLVWKKREPANRIGEASIKNLRIRINFYDFLGFAKDA